MFFQRTLNPKYELFFEANVSFKDMDVFPTKMVMLIGKTLISFWQTWFCEVSFIENILAEHVGEHIGNNRIRKTPTPPTLPKRKKTIRCILAHFIGCQEFACLCL